MIGLVVFNQAFFFQDLFVLVSCPGGNYSFNPLK